MNIGGQILRPAPPRRSRHVADRERFLTFALTAAEMLIEASPDRRIDFAAGTFQSRLGDPPEAWLGRPVQDLVALPDRAAFDAAFGVLLARDRLPPTSFRLADMAAAPVSGCHVGSASPYPPCRCSPDPHRPWPGLPRCGTRQ